MIHDFYAFDPRFTGGVQVAVGDVDADGYSEVIAAAGAGGGPQVKVFDGRSMIERLSGFVFDQGFSGGVSVAPDDFDGDRDADRAVAADADGDSEVVARLGNTSTGGLAVRGSRDQATTTIGASYPALAKQSIGHGWRWSTSTTRRSIRS